MKQIKTVLRAAMYAQKFDEEVNGLLGDGWKLKKRETLKTSGEMSEAFSAPLVTMLYAELEREVPPFPEESTI